MFVWPLLVQTTAALCEGLDAAWLFFGGIPKRIVPDNMTSAIVRPDAKDPGIQRSFLEYAQARGERWCRDVAGARVHGTLFELLYQGLCAAQNRLVDVGPVKKSNERVYLFGPELGPGAHRPLPLPSSETRAETRALAAKTAFAIDKEYVAQFAASGADQCQVASSPAPLQAHAYASRRRQAAVLGKNDDVDVGCIPPIWTESVGTARVDGRSSRRSSGRRCGRCRRRASSTRTGGGPASTSTTTCSSTGISTRCRIASYMKRSKRDSPPTSSRSCTTARASRRTAAHR